MEKRFKFLFLLLCCLISSSAIAQQRLRNVSKQEAFSLVKDKFSGQDVDYYLCEDPVLKIEGENNFLDPSQSGTWTFFVDAEPMKGWEHDCYIVRVVKRIGEYQSPMPQSTKFRLPPMGNFSPLEVKNRYGIKANQKPYVRKATLSNEAKSAAGHTYAVILSGGHNKYSNYERYWNDCSFVYQTLVNKYGVPKNNIAVVMSDGTNPAEDMHLTTGGYKSSPLDLDYDGWPDIKYAATRTNVRHILSGLSQKMTKDDHLFFYVIDHGGTRDNKNQSYICLWNGESLHDYELADWLLPFNQKSIYVNAVLGQCFSGGFIEELTKVGCVVAAASRGDEPSWACPDIPHDEFVYQWTSAINGKEALGGPIFSDTDKNKRVTMKEAFDYAKAHDRRSQEHPQYKSNPISIGEDLAFNNLPEAVDLYIKDNDEDTGKEPNLTTTILWDSPSIWVRNIDDSIEIHENPYYAKDHPYAIIYVKIHNRGKEDYKGGQWLHMYWALASTGFNAKAWKGQEYYTDYSVTGGHLEPAYIKPIKAGEYRIISVTWPLPRNLMAKDNGTEKHHFCLLGQIFNDWDPELKGIPMVQQSNDIAQKNVSVISKENLPKGTNVFVRNIYKDNHKYSLEIRPRTLADKTLLSKARLKMEMSFPIYDAWKRGGCHAKGIAYAPVINPRKVEFSSWEGCLEDICMNGADFEKVIMNIDFQKPATSLNETYTFDLIQKDEKGNIVGGETFIVEAPLHSHQGIEITPIDLGDGRYKLSTNWQETDQVLWTDAVGSDVGTGNNITVTPTLTNNKFSAIAISSQGEMAQESITLESKTGFKSISPTPVEDFIDIELHSPVKSGNAVLRINSLAQTGSILLSKHIPLDAKKIQLNATSLPSGIYVLTYFVDNQIVDSRKFSKK